MKKGLILRFGMSLTVLALMLAIVGPVAGWAGVSTKATISANATEVLTGSTVTLIITETNDSAIWTGVDLTPAWVELAPLGLSLNSTSPGFSSSLNNDAILDLGETWTWTLVVTVSQTTTFVATGHGFTPATAEEASKDVTYDTGDLDERAEVTVTVTSLPPPPPPPPPGDEGLTPGYWKNHLSAWQGYTPSQYFDAVFGVGPHVTLLKALQTGGGGAFALGRHAVAALLNAASSNVDYPLAEAQVIALVQNAYATGTFEGVKNTLEGYNELGN
ncbi:MAG: hypothetical protein HY665_07900 [Chloroflexi bacterium]|nr:hypothetical protein [Chloroflexota bacterium]